MPGDRFFIGHLFFNFLGLTNHKIIGKQGSLLNMSDLYKPKPTIQN